MTWGRIRTGLSLIILAIVAAAAFITIDPNKVTCGGRVMSENQVCDHTRRGRVTGSNNYEEEKRNQNIMKWAGGVLTLPLAIGGVWVLSAGFRRRKQGDGPQPGQQHYPQYPGQPGQNLQYPQNPQYSQYPQNPQGGHPPQPGQYPQYPGQQGQHPQYPQYPQHPQQPGYPPQQPPPHYPPHGQ